MRITGARNEDKVNGYYIRDATKGFFGDKLEGNTVLKTMGLMEGVLPFSMAFYLKNRKVQWKDQSGNEVTMQFRITPQKIEFYVNYLHHRKTSVLFREWENYENKEDIAHMESEAIGYQSMMCLYDRLVKR